MSRAEEIDREISRLIGNNLGDSKDKDPDAPNKVYYLMRERAELLSRSRLSKRNRCPKCGHQLD